jgi:predicted esterase
MDAHKITVSKTAHYFTLGTPGPHVQQIWIVCHGYAQLADAFLEQFQLLDDGTRLVIAPEGMNHFYRKGFDGSVVANWMTRRHREDEIIDYANYLQLIYNQYVSACPEGVRIVLLGFSQGTATICRWMLQCLPHFHDLLLWAGLPPEDLDYAAHASYLKTKNLYLLYGSHDPFLTPDRLSTLEAIEQKNQVDFSERSFEGGHEILPDTLLDFIKNMN